MKKTALLIISLVLASVALGQKIGESTIKRFSFGLDLYTDLWLSKPEGIKEDPALLC